MRLAFDNTSFNETFRELGRCEGIEKVIDKGCVEERTALALKLLRRNRPIYEIAEDTGLSRVVVE